VFMAWPTSSLLTRRRSISNRPSRNTSSSIISTWGCGVGRVQEKEGGRQQGKEGVERCVCVWGEGGGEGKGADGR
jgi:hypothetical protein